MLLWCGVGIGGGIVFVVGVSVRSHDGRQPTLDATLECGYVTDWSEDSLAECRGNTRATWDRQEIGVGKEGLTRTEICAQRTQRQGKRKERARVDIEGLVSAEERDVGLREERRGAKRSSKGEGGGTLSKRQQVEKAIMKRMLRIQRVEARVREFQQPRSQQRLCVIKGSG